MCCYWCMMDDELCVFCGGWKVICVLFSVYDGWMMNCVFFVGDGRCFVCCFWWMMDDELCVFLWVMEGDLCAVFGV